MIGKTVSHYAILERIGQGGMGIVYKARDTRLERLVALKFLPPEMTSEPQARERFLREARAASALEHPNICVIHAIEETDDGQLFIAMAYYEGESLAQALARGPLEPREAAQIVLQVVDGLGKAHREGIYHRDIKPANIFVTPEGQAKILDFGLAKLESRTQLTRDGTILGTAAYMAPEQVRSRPVDGRTDLWAVGAVLFESISGRTPFQGDREHATIYRILNDPPDIDLLAARAPAEIVRLVESCLQRDAAQRFQSAEELAQELAGFLGLASAPPLTAGSPGTQAPSLLSRPALDFNDQTAFSGGHLRDSLLARPEGFVARETELAQLDRLLELAVAGHGQVALIAGEPGQGKTALMIEFARRAEIRYPNLLTVSGKCNAQTGARDPFQPFRQVLALLAADLGTSGVNGLLSRGQAARLQRLMPRFLRHLLDLAPDLVDNLLPGAALVDRARRLGAADGDLLEELEERVRQSSGGVQQRDLFAQYARLLQALTAEQPLLVALDDLQWTDGGSANLLAHLASELESSRLMLVGTYRSEDLPSSTGGQAHPLPPVLNRLKHDRGDIEIRLDDADGQAFVDAFVDAQPQKLGRQFREALYRQTKGVPLFTTEVVQAMRDQGLLAQDEDGEWVETADLDWSQVPARVDAVVAGRLDGLGQEMIELLTVASVEGEEFSAEVIAKVLDKDRRQVARLLSEELSKRHRLVRAQRLRRIASGRRLSGYQFRNKLYQQHLYRRLDEVERPYLHEDVGAALAELYGDNTAEVAVQLARHYLEAQIPDQAARYLSQAGRQALSVSAAADAIGHLETARETLSEMPAGADRDRLELEIQTALATALSLSRGYAAPEVREGFLRAQVLCDTVGETPELFWVVQGLWTFHITVGRLQEALQAGRQLDRLAEQSGDPKQAVYARYSEGVSLRYLGELAAARERLTANVGLEELARSGTRAASFDAVLASRSQLALTLWQLGHAEQAVRMNDGALTLGREIDHVVSRIVAIEHQARLQHLMRETVAVGETAQRVVELAAQNDAVFWAILGGMLLGWAQAMTKPPGDEDADAEAPRGLALMRQNMAALEAMGVNSERTFHATLLGEVHLHRGELDSCGEVLTGGLAEAQAGARLWEPELHRLSGELALARQDPAAATESFRRAMATAAGQGCLAFELRAATALARQLLTRGGSGEARELLAGICRRFEDGQDTADLRAAGALLAELG